jgi:hypothetical protein
VQADAKDCVDESAGHGAGLLALLAMTYLREGKEVYQGLEQIYDLVVASHAPERLLTPSRRRTRWSGELVEIFICVDRHRRGEKG